ncbi:MAG TPA: hypothetical protein VEU72_03380 [Nitrosopumilaceae archaeon]|nr:hypothetical protein [Nitrosopumilaceae archaeon]
MITAEALSIEFEHRSKKLEPIANNCILLSAGSALNPTEVFENVKTTYAHQQFPQIKEILNSVKQNYVEVRNRKAEEEIFYPVSMSISSFQKNQNAMNDNIVLKLDHELAEYDLGLTILLAGVDSTGAHLHTIENPGVSAQFDKLGFCCLGSGQRHAFDSLIVNNYHIELPFKEAMFATYEAKKKAELAPGVGGKTDMLYIDEKGVHMLNDATINNLQAIYEEKIKLNQPTESKIKDMINKMELK